MENNILKNRDFLLTADDETIIAGCIVNFFKSTGKGGQKRNKTSSAVRLTHIATAIQTDDCSERSQHRNRAIALKKLRFAIALNFRVHPAVPPENLLTLSPLNTAHLFDVLAEAEFELAAAAAKLEISTSKLLKILNKEPRLFAKFNEFRVQSGKTVLHA